METAIQDIFLFFNLCKGHEKTLGLQAKPKNATKKGFYIFQQGSDAQ